MDHLYTVKQVLTLPVGSEVKVAGWIRTRRSTKQGLSFLDLCDGSTHQPLQVVVPESMSTADESQRLSSGCSVVVHGTWVPSRGAEQANEVVAQQVEVTGWVEDPATYPMAPKAHSPEHLREHAHLRVRTQRFSAIARLRHRIAHTIHHFFHEEGFFWVPTPIITSADCEGAGTLFQLAPVCEEGQPPREFFKKPAYLTVSGQLNAETYACALSKVYTFGPTFRAENSNTSRHLAEFWMIEPEMAFTDLAGIAQLAQRLLQSIFQAVLEHESESLQFFEQQSGKPLVEQLRQVAEQAFVTLEYSDAITLLTKSKHPFDFPVQWGIDLACEHERYLTQHYGKPVVVQNYPKGIKAFYMRSNDDGKTVAAMDVLVPGMGEIIGGSQREERLEVLDARMKEMGIEPLSWYRDLRRYGTVPHAGFGLGLERVVAYVAGLDNIRDAIPFPRTPGHLLF